MYNIRIEKSAAKQLKKIPKVYALNIVTGIYALANDPFPHGFKKLVGFENVYRIRIADYRIIYEIENDVLFITVVAIGHRKDVYRK